MASEDDDLATRQIETSDTAPIRKLQAPSSDVRDIALEDITVPPERLRKLRPGKVDEFAKSMAEIGLINPITVSPMQDGTYKLVAGKHRLRAARQLGWASIQCVVRHGENDLTGLALIEIDENLIRADLTTEERALHLHLRRELWEEECGTSRPTSKVNKGFAADTAEATGMSKRQINRILAGKKPKSDEPKPETEPRKKRSKTEEHLCRYRLCPQLSGMAAAFGTLAPERMASAVDLDGETLAILKQDIKTIRRWLDRFIAALDARAKR